MLGKFTKFVLAGACVLGFAQGAQAVALINGGFEQPGLNEGFEWIDEGLVPGWDTSASDQQIELWSDGYRTVNAYQGSQFAELNANMPSTLFQNVSGIAAGSVIGYEFAHRGREGVDQMRFTLTDLGADGNFGTADDEVLFSDLFNDGNTAWGFYQGTGITALGGTIRFAFEAVSWTGGNTYGNFLDAIDFGVGVGAGDDVTAVPTPAAIWLFGLGIFCLGVGLTIRRRRDAAMLAA